MIPYSKATSWWVAAIRPRGIAERSTIATVELRVLLHDVVTGTLLAWPLVTISLYVDDATLEVVHSSARVVQAALAGATDRVVDSLQTGLQLCVSTTKSLAVGSSTLLARAHANAKVSRDESRKDKQA